MASMVAFPLFYASVHSWWKITLNSKLQIVEKTKPGSASFQISNLSPLCRTQERTIQPIKKKDEEEVTAMFEAKLALLISH